MPLCVLCACRRLSTVENMGMKKFEHNRACGGLELGKQEEQCHRNQMVVNELQYEIGVQEGVRRHAFKRRCSPTLGAAGAAERFALCSLRRATGASSLLGRVVMVGGCL